MSNSHTVVISIGNSDNKLSQSDWSRYIEEFRVAVFRFGDEQFLGYTAPDSMYQSCTTVLSVSDALVTANGWEKFDDWMEYVVKPSLADLAKRFGQDSIAVTVGKTEFVMALR